MQKKIELMIKGVQKVWSTSLNRYLSQHPKMYTFINLDEYAFDISLKYNERKEQRVPFLAKILFPGEKTILKNITPQTEAKNKTKTGCWGANEKKEEGEQGNNSTGYPISAKLFK